MNPMTPLGERSGHLDTVLDDPAAGVDVQLQQAHDPFVLLSSLHELRQRGGLLESTPKMFDPTETVLSSPNTLRPHRPNKPQKSDVHCEQWICGNVFLTVMSRFTSCRSSLPFPSLSYILKDHLSLSSRFPRKIRAPRHGLKLKSWERVCSFSLSRRRVPVNPINSRCIQFLSLQQAEVELLLQRPPGLLSLPSAGPRALSVGSVLYFLL
ncbi:hypothetical protein FQN60_005417 [Etheostoma spectabile]|uniref:Uncharacterized protein n=1 Tax=Etheostoma spectabile TaxID=54343 RepID=A0A5J5C944_9PERO|nr:hypothetical protein FQN60_005417 [Etheostoma spectabile]